MPLPAAASTPVDGEGLSHVVRALYLLHTEQVDLAIAELRLAMIYEPRSAFLHEKLAAAYLAGDHGEEADAVLRNGLQYNPEDAGLNLLRGQMALDDWNYGQAVQFLQKAVKSDELLAYGASFYIDALLWNHQVQTALAAAQDFMDRRPADADLCVTIAAALEDHAQLDGALLAYQRARAQQPADRGAALGEVRVHMLQGNVAAAAAALLPLLSFFPDQPELYVQLARLLDEAQRPGGDAYRNEALRQTEGDAAGRLTVATGDMLMGRFDAATTLLTQSLQGDPNHSEGRIFLAGLHLQRGDFKAALAALAPAQGPAVDRLRAHAHAGLGQLDASFADLARLAAAGAAADAVNEAARLLLQTGAAAKAARERLQQFAKQLKPKLNDETWRLVQVALADAAGDGTQAVNLMVSLADAHPDDVGLQLHLADLQVRYGWVADAVQLLEDLVHGDPYDATRLNALGFTLVDAQERMTDANVWVRRAFRLASEDGFVMDSLGWLLWRQGRKSEAATWLKRAHAAMPDDPEIMRHLGDVLSATGQTAQARQVYRHALEMAPPWALRKLLQQRLGLAS